MPSRRPGLGCAPDATLRLWPPRNRPFPSARSQKNAASRDPRPQGAEERPQVLPHPLRQARGPAPRRDPPGERVVSIRGAARRHSASAATNPITLPPTGGTRTSRATGSPARWSCTPTSRPSSCCRVSTVRGGGPRTRAPPPGSLTRPSLARVRRHADVRAESGRDWAHPQERRRGAGARVREGVGASRGPPVPRPEHQGLDRPHTPSSSFLVLIGHW